MEKIVSYFPVSPWKLEEPTLKHEHIALAQTLFSLANGYIGSRGTLEECHTMHPPMSQEGTYLNGVYIRQPIFYDEVAHAFATHNNKMVQVPDAKALHVAINGELFTPDIGQCIAHTRTLDFHTASTTRTTLWKLDEQRQVEITQHIIISLHDLHVMASHYTLTPRGFSADIHVSAVIGTGHLESRSKDAVDPRAGHISITESLEEYHVHQEDAMIRLCHRVAGSGFLVYSGMSCMASHATTDSAVLSVPKGSYAHNFSAQLADGEAFTLTRFVSYHHSLDEPYEAGDARLQQSLHTARTQGFEHYIQTQKTQVSNFWSHADIEIVGDDALQQGIRFNLLHIFMSSGKDGRSSIGAKGLSGPGYDGHYFWDTEMYVVPLFTYTMPDVARALLEYRFSILESARTRARQMAHPTGALYAWRTIGGEECSSYFPAGTAQYHINGAIAYAIVQYVQATDDWEFMYQYGMEMLCEMARVWLHAGHFSAAHDGAFCLHTVTGPDEYTAMVDNNFYTNAIARNHLRGTLNAISHMRTHFPDRMEALAQRIALKPEELAAWQQAADHMRLAHDETHGIYQQDDTFLSKKPWDFAHAPKEKYPLLLHYHPLVIYRHQVLKQGDVVQAMALFGHEFDQQKRRASFDYYEPLTTHDSTLSSCIHSIEAARIGYSDKAYSFFENNARMDIDNYHHNTEYGLHMACMAGSWMSIVFGFAGLEIYNNQLHFAPRLPEQWQALTFSLRFRGAHIRVRMERSGTHYHIQQGDSVTLLHHGAAITLTQASPAYMPSDPIKEQKHG